MDSKSYHLVTLAGLMHDLGKLVRAQQESVQKDKPYGRANSSQGTHAGDSVNFLAYVGADQLPDWSILADIVFNHHEEGWAQQNRTLGQIVSKADQFSSRERVELEKTKDRPQLESIFRQISSVYAEPQVAYYRAAVLEPSTAFPQPQGPAFQAFTPLIERLEQEMQALFAQVQALPHLTVALTELMAQYATVTNCDKQTFPFDISLFDHLSTTSAIAACLYLYHAGTGKWGESDLDSVSEEKFLLIGCDLSGIQAYLYEIAQIGSGGVAKRLRARSFYLTALLDVIGFRLCQELVEELGVALPLNCQVIKSGGRFILLAPNLPSVREKLAFVDREVNQWLRTETHGDLACYFTALPLAGRDFITEHNLQAGADDENPPGASSIMRKIDEVYQALNQAKEQRYHDLLYGAGSGGWRDAFVQRSANVHYPPGDGTGSGGACRSCGKLPVDLGVVAESERRGEVLHLCRRCDEDIRLGRRLVDARYLGYRRGAAARRQDVIDLAFFPEDQRYTLRVSPDAAGLDGFEADFVEQLAWDSQCFDDRELYLADVEAARQTGYRYPLRRRRLANYVPAEAGEILPFDQLAKRSGREALAGHVEPLIGVLRMDVDQLGMLLANGLGQVTSLSRVATFSRMLDLFFSGWIETKLRRPYLHNPKGKVLVDSDRMPVENPYRDVYIVYAGGDDLLLAGPWDKTIQLAQDLQQDFTRFTNQNPNITISAAVEVVKPRYPVSRSARHAGTLLKDYAKAAGRNRLHLFGVTASWYHRSPPDDAKESIDEDVWLALDDRSGITVDELWSWATFFDDQLYEHRLASQGNGQRYPVSSHLAHRILQLSKMSERVRSQKKAHIDDLTYMAQLAYVIGRNVSEKRFKAYFGADAYQEEYAAVTGKLMELTQLQNINLMAHLQMPLTWALYRNRQRSEDRA